MSLMRLFSRHAHLLGCPLRDLDGWDGGIAPCRCAAIEAGTLTCTDYPFPYNEPVPLDCDCACGHIPDECGGKVARDGARRAPRLINPWRETYIAVAWVLGILLAVSLLSWWITGQPPFQVQAAEPPRIFADGFEDRSGGGGEPPDPCAPELINPAGWTPIYTTWTEVFSAPDGSPSAAYPAGMSFMNPIGADKGTGLVLTIVPYLYQYVNLYIDQVQPVPSQGYPVSRPAEAMFIGFTRCTTTRFGQTFFALDLRPPVYMARDPMQWPACRIFENQGGLGWHSGHIPNVCHLDAGVPVGMVIAPYDPTTRDHACSNVANSQLGCDVGSRLSTGHVPHAAAQ